MAIDILLAEFYNKTVPNGTVLEETSMKEEHIVGILASSALFGSAERETLDKIAKCTVSRFNAAEPIYSTDSYRKCLGVILSGKVEMFGTSCNNTVRLNTATVGEIFGAAALFGSPEQYVSVVRAKTAAEVLFIDENEMERFIRSDSSLALAYIAFLSDRIRFLNRKITSFTAKNADDATAQALLESGVDEFKVNMSRLCKQLDIGRTSLYRSFENLVRLGTIEYSEGTVKILDRKALRELIS